MPRQNYFSNHILTKNVSQKRGWAVCTRPKFQSNEAPDIPTPRFLDQNNIRLQKNVFIIISCLAILNPYLDFLQKCIFQKLGRLIWCSHAIEWMSSDAEIRGHRILATLVSWVIELIRWRCCQALSFYYYHYPKFPSCDQWPQPKLSYFNINHLSYPG